MNGAASNLAFRTKRYVGLVLGTSPGKDDDLDAKGYLAFVSKSLSPGSGPDPERDTFAIPIGPIVTAQGASPRPRSPQNLSGCYPGTLKLRKITSRVHAYPPFAYTSWPLANLPGNALSQLAGQYWSEIFV